MSLTNSSSLASTSSAGSFASSLYKRIPISPTDFDLLKEHHPSSSASSDILQRQQLASGDRWITFADIQAANIHNINIPLPSRPAPPPPPARSNLRSSRFSSSPPSSPSPSAPSPPPINEILSLPPPRSSSLSPSPTSFRPLRSPTRRDTDLRKQVLTTCFTHSPAGQKSLLMGHRMAIRLWEANRELERLVKLHESAVYSVYGGGVEEECLSNSKSKSTLSSSPPPTPPPSRASSMRSFNTRASSSSSPSSSTRSQKSGRGRRHKEMKSFFDWDWDSDTDFSNTTVSAPSPASSATTSSYRLPRYDESPRAISCY